MYNSPLPSRERGWGRGGSFPLRALTHHLILPPEVLQRHTQHVHQASEREENKDRQTQKYMEFVNPAHANQESTCTTWKGKEPLCPAGNQQQGAAIKWPKSGHNGGKPKN